ncbi:MAG: hypothetical protein AB7I59_05475 [Geminicoccaceae bacterium]
MLDPAEVEAVHGWKMPRPRGLSWRLVDQPGGIVLEIASRDPVCRWPPVRIAAELLEHVEGMFDAALTNVAERVDALPVEDGHLVLAELGEYRALISGPPAWLSLIRGGREIAACRFEWSADFYLCVASARIVSMYYGRLPAAGLAN